MLKNINIILVETSHPGNIGSAARAMKTMTLSAMRLVNPAVFPSDHADALSAGATDILRNAEVFSSVDEAINDCQLIVGTSTRHRKLSWPTMSARESMPTLSEAMREGQKVAILFGPEQSGLTNEDLRKCHFHIYIPSNEAYSSLNLAQAVQVISYELLMSMHDIPTLKDTHPEPLATREQFNGFFNDFEKLLYEIKVINRHQPEKYLARLRRLFFRANLYTPEVDILRGIISHIRRLTTDKL